MSMKLRELIRKVRACKTAAEERAVIAKESAMIRTAIREEQVHYRHRNVAKLLFMHMLGYPTHFGQLECMKLTASPHFPEKRIGYLGMMLLLSEEADVLMLATNALKNDLNSEIKFVAGLALCSIGNLATADMSRDLAPEVDKHLKSPLSYLRKKACLAMARCLLKCPDMVEDFVDRVVTLLKDKSHGVLITVVQLMTRVLMIDYRNAEEEGEDPFETPCRASFLRLVPTLVKMLRNLLSTGYSPDHDVGGISDPFLQVQLLTLLRLLGSNNERASEEMNDVLAQVATNTETSKNAGNAILYECVQTIMGVESEDGLRVLAVNILGRFLLNRDNNIRYVALNTLSTTIVQQKQSNRIALVEDVGSAASESANNAMSALQRHRTTVVDCLKDPDVSIRQRALELIYHLVNETNVRSLTAELLNYLVLCPREHRADICTRVLKVADRYSPDDRWRVDTLITTLTIAGREASPTVQSAAVVYISRASADVHAFATHRLLKAIRDDDGSQHGLLAVGVWCIGEYGDLLLKPYSYSAPPTPTAAGGGVEDLTGTAASNGPVSITFMALEPLAVVNTVEDVTKRHACPEYVKQRALTAYVKLSERLKDCGDPRATEKLEKLVRKHEGSRSLELQLRACEYNALMSASKGMTVPRSSKKPPPQPDAEPDLFGVEANGDASGVGGGAVSSAVQSAAKGALTRMPVVDIKVLQKRLTSEADEVGDDNDGLAAAPRAAGKVVSQPSHPAAAAGGDLLDLQDIFGGGTAAPSAPTQNGSVGGPQPVGAAPAAADATAAKSDLDLLSDIFAAPAAHTVATGSAPEPVAATGAGYDPFSAPPPAQQTQPQTAVGAPASTTAVPVNPLDLFGPAPAAAAPAPAVANNSAGIDLFGGTPAPTPMAQQNSAPAAPVAPADPFGAPAPPPKAAPAAVVVQALSHAGIAVELECTKPDQWNKQKSTLVAKFKNSTGEPVYGMNLQCAVPKYVQMEMDPPTSTTVPVSGGNSKQVTQRIHVTNTMLGTKNLMLKFKIGFTTKGQKIDHMATCSGFPPGQF